MLDDGFEPAIRQVRHQNDILWRTKKETGREKKVELEGEGEGERE